MDIGCYEVLLDGLTINSKVHTIGEIIPRKLVSKKLIVVWDNPATQRKIYGKFVVRPRPAGFTGEVEEFAESPMGVQSTIGSAASGMDSGARRPPGLGPEGELGISGMKSSG